MFTRSPALDGPVYLDGGISDRDLKRRGRARAFAAGLSYTERMPMKDRTCPSCGSRLVRWRIEDGRRRNLFADFVKGLLRGARMPAFTRGPVTITLTTLWERPRDLTPQEREVVDDLVCLRKLRLVSGWRGGHAPPAVARARLWRAGARSAEGSAHRLTRFWSTFVG